MPSLYETVTSLRSGIDLDSHAPETQQRYEQALKREHWKLRDEAIPLVIGVDPSSWSAYLRENELGEFEAALYACCLPMLSAHVVDGAVPVEVLIGAFRSEGVELPASLTRLYDFIRQMTLQTVPATETVPPDAADDERAIVLGAALSIVTKMPERCRDKDGFFDGALITNLIFQTAVRWFPMSAPTMSREQVAALIDKHLE